MNNCLYFEVIQTHALNLKDDKLIKILKKKYAKDPILNDYQISYLQGLNDSGIDGTKELIRAIIDCHEIKLCFPAEEDC